MMDGKNEGVISCSFAHSTGFAFEVDAVSFWSIKVTNLKTLKNISMSVDHIM